jgi:hypothetical protein
VLMILDLMLLVPSYLMKFAAELIQGPTLFLSAPQLPGTRVR